MPNMCHNGTSATHNFQLEMYNALDCIASRSQNANEKLLPKKLFPSMKTVHLCCTHCHPNVSKHIQMMANPAWMADFSRSTRCKKLELAGCSMPQLSLFRRLQQGNKVTHSEDLWSNCGHKFAYAVMPSRILMASRLQPKGPLVKPNKT